jgi:hypothetical protein
MASQHLSKSQPIASSLVSQDANEMINWRKTLATLGHKNMKSGRNNEEIDDDSWKFV